MKKTILALTISGILLTLGACSHEGEEQQAYTTEAKNNIKQDRMEADSINYELVAMEETVINTKKEQRQLINPAAASPMAPNAKIIGGQAPLPSPVIKNMEETVINTKKKQRQLINPATVGLMAPNTKIIGRQAPIVYSVASLPSPVIKNTEKYQTIAMSAIKLVSKDPVSTFSIDVDTGSYSNVRRIIQSGQLPPKNAVRIEEMVNYFSYDYPNSDSKETPFSTSIEIAPSPWNKDAQLLHIGIKGYTPDAPRPASNLIFLIDVSGSMHSANKLGLLKASLTLLTKQLTAQDKISIVVYAGAAGMVLEPTSGNNQHKIINALNKLRAGGSTNGNAGIQLAYQLAEENFIKDGINRILIATDGDFNVGISNINDLKTLIAKKRKTGIYLTTLGFGAGNYNEHLMEQIADVGNGNYAYIDSLKEANKVLVEEMKSTLMTIAKDVKIQIEFNPDVVSQYRLIGYENRALRNQDFANDKIDAGEIGAGHSVTALYEIILKDNKGWVKAMRYQQNKIEQNTSLSNELAHLRIRYKQPNADKSQLLEWPLYRKEIKDSLASTSANFRFAAAVAGFAQLLKNNQYLQNFTFDDVIELASKARGQDSLGYRGEFNQLVSLAKALAKPVQVANIKSTTN